MKKNTLMNKKVIKALTIGLSASIMFQPIGALADENITEPVLDDGIVGEEEEVSEASVENEAAMQVENVEAANEEAKDKISDAIDAVEIVADKKILDDVAKLQDAADELEEAAGTLDEEHTEIVDEEEVTVVGATTEAVNEVKDSIDTLIEESNTIEGALTAADNAADDAQEITAEVLKTEEQAVKDMDAIIAKIKQDGTITAANESYVRAEEIVKAADAAYEQAKVEYEAAKSDYDTSVALVEEAQAKYDEALANGEENLAVAEEELKALKEKSAALKEAADEAQAAFNSTEEGKLLALDAKANAAKTADWKNTLDPLFDSVMKEYYVNKFVDENATDIKTKVFKEGSNDDYFYFEVTFKDANNEEQTKYYAYRMANKNVNGGMVIYEKTESFFVGDTDEKFVLEDTDKEKLSAGEIVIINENDDFVIENGEGEYVVAKDKDTDDDFILELDDNQEIDEETINTTYTFDEEGNLVKSTTADVVTTLFEDKSFDSENVTYTSEDAAKAAGEVAMQEYIDNLAEGTEVTDVEVNAVSTTVSTATATYYVTFTKTVNVSESGTKHWFNDPKAEITNSITEGVDAEDYLVSVDANNITVKESTIMGIGSYNASGSLTYTYVETDDATGDYSILGDLFGISDSEAKATEKIDKKLADNGYIRMGDIVGFDWNIFKCSYEYTVAYTATGEGDDDASAYAKAVEEANKAAAALSGDKGTAKAVIAGPAKYNHTTTYTYEVSFTEVTTEVTEDVEVDRVTWTEDELIDTTLRYTNDKLDAGDVFVTSSRETSKNGEDFSFTGNDKKTVVNVSDEQLEKIQRETKEFRDFLNGIKADKDSIDALVSAADDADKAVKAAQDEVDALKDMLSKLTKDGSADAIKDMQAKLDAALENLENAKNNKDIADSKLKDAQDARYNRIDELTPAPEPEVVPEPEETPAPAVNNGRTPRPARVVAPTEDVEIEDEEPALAETPEEAVEENTEVVVEEPVAEIEEVPTVEEAPVVEEAVIEEEETPLANLPEQQQMSWWWLLIVLVLGTTGAEMYRRHMVKKNALKVESEKKDK